jgi:glycine/D-amino acid oxidase-like deaminating enzyme
MPIPSDSSPVTFQDPLPTTVDVVVMGAGVIGISTAWFLRDAGVSVFVCEKGRVAGEQSSRNWGWIRQQGRDAAEVPIAVDSVNLWEQLSRELDEDIGFARSGVLYTARTDRELARFERWISIAERYQLDTRMLTAAEVDTLVDDNPNQWKGGMFTPSDARAEPFVAVPALARALRKRGGLIRECCAVRTLDVEAGRVSGVVTEHGRVRANTVVCAAGAWSTRFLGNLGVNLPQLTARATVARTAPCPTIYEGGATLGEVAIRRRRDGGYTVAAGSRNEHFAGRDTLRYFSDFLPAFRASTRWLDLRFGGDLLARLFPTRRWTGDDVTPFERVRVLNPEPSRDALRQMRDGLRKRVPKLADLPFEESWAGMIDVMPDVVPVMDRVAQYPGLYLATGFSGHGFGIGPGAGKVMAEMVMGKAPRHDLHRFRMARFSDGSKKEIGPGL